MAKKWGIEFDGYERLKKQLDEIGGEATERAVEGALKQTQILVARKCDAAMRSHIRTGATKRAIIKDGNVEWTGTTASVDVGFDIENGGKPSIYLMNGTVVRGEQHITADKSLREAVYGSKTKKEAQELQKQAFEKVLKRVMKDEE